MIDIRDNGRYADDSSFAGREIQIHLDMTGAYSLEKGNLNEMLIHNDFLQINKSPSLWNENSGRAINTSLRS